RLLRSRETEPPAQPGLEAVHLAVVHLVIVAEQVQIPVEEQPVQLFPAALAPSARLSRGVRQRADNISESSPVPRESENIGRPIFSPIVPVERTHARVSAEKNGELGPGRRSRREAVSGRAGPSREGRG